MTKRKSSAKNPEPSRERLFRASAKSKKGMETALGITSTDSIRSLSISKRLNVSDAIRVVQVGIPATQAQDVFDELGASIDARMLIVGISHYRWKKLLRTRGRLDKGSSERVVRMAQLLAFASEVLGGRERARIWFQRPNSSLGGNSPLNLMDTSFGAREVENVLGRIEHGVFG